MIIDLKEKFLKLREETELSRKEKLHQDYLNRYLDLREEWVSSDNNVCNLFSDRYSFDNSDGFDWCSLTSLCDDIYDVAGVPGKTDIIREYIRERADLLDDLSKEVQDSLELALDEKIHPFIKVLVGVEKIMVSIAELRDEFGKKLDDNVFLLKSQFDSLTTGDYLRISIMEDLVLEEGAFDPEALEVFT
jgi:hypothetical protein